MLLCDQDVDEFCMMAMGTYGEHAVDGDEENKQPYFIKNVGSEDLGLTTDEEKKEAEEATELSAGALFMQGVATSIDALSVGFTISEYGWLMALAASIIIAVVTFFLCMAGLNIGKKFGTELSGKASILGGVILIGIGLEIFISGIMG